MKGLAIEFRGVDFNRGQTQILNGMNLRVELGERLAIIGSSGSGKTTCLRLCAGLERASAGQILLRGVAVDSKNTFVPPHQRRIGFVFQNYALFEKVSVEKNIFYGCKTSSHYEEAERLMEVLDLRRHLQKWPGQLSGGERQKVALLRSLALKPDIMLLDEPFSSLDGEQSFSLIQEIKDLFTQLQVTAIMVTHSKAEADAFASRTYRFK